jgi:hypothetical protein
MKGVPCAGIIPIRFKGYFSAHLAWAPRRTKAMAPPLWRALEPYSETAPPAFYVETDIAWVGGVHEFHVLSVTSADIGNRAVARQAKEQSET